MQNPWKKISDAKKSKGAAGRELYKMYGLSIAIEGHLNYYYKIVEINKLLQRHEQKWNSWILLIMFLINYKNKQKYL